MNEYVYKTKSREDYYEVIDMLDKLGYRWLFSKDKAKNFTPNLDGDVYLSINLDNKTLLRAPIYIDAYPLLSEIVLDKSELERMNKRSKTIDTNKKVKYNKNKIYI